VDLRDGAKVDPYPDGKLYSDDMARHVGDAENPHGRTLTQDELVVRKKLILPTEDFEVQIGDDAVPASAFSDAVSQVAGRRIEVVDFESFGQDGGVKSASRRVRSVQIHRRVLDGMAGSLGEIGIGYFGQDNKVDLENEFSVYNTGDAGIPLRAMVLCG